jgi:hypothetical protein
MASRFTAQVPKVGTSWTLILEEKKQKKTNLTCSTSWLVAMLLLLKSK